ncbi:hypothetical protein VNI00_009589 [Paramarasmius palmivorus]|uniref:DUF6589 domain-containing protein n=1 Tax=Paramarasmius palmivorus TaxID=297713 RepID=A0AAW0CRH7_9AGAR
MAENEDVEWNMLFEDPESYTSYLYTADTSDDGSDSNSGSSSEDDDQQSFEPRSTPTLSSYIPTEITNEPPFIRNTRILREKIGNRPMASSVRRVLAVMKEEGLDLPLFLDFLSWGDESCVQDPTIQYARSALLGSVELLGIFRRWFKPPRSKRYKKKRASRAQKVMVEIAKEILGKAIEEELEDVGGYFRTGSVGDLRAEELTRFDFELMRQMLLREAPLVSNFVEDLAIPECRRKGDKVRKSDSKVCPYRGHAQILVLFVSLLSYSQNNRHNRMQKMLAIYFKFKGTTAKAFDTLHALGLTMSFKWTTESVPRMSNEKMIEVCGLLPVCSWELTYDNIEIATRVYSQRLDNLKQFTSGTACTVYVRRGARRLSPHANRDLQEKRAEGMKSPLTPIDIFTLSQQAQVTIDVHATYIIMQYLLDALEFELHTYTGKSSVLLRPPPPVCKLATGPDQVTNQFLLGTVNMAEASYEDHIQLLPEWLRQLGMGEESKKEHIGWNQVFFFIGDQLTVSRLRGLFQQRAEDVNSFERLEWLITPFGWFHFAMAAANTYHTQYLGRAKGSGLLNAFNQLERKGLNKVETKGVFHHHLNEALHHVAEAEIRACWLAEGGVATLSELRTKTPQQLQDMAATIYRKHATSLAIDKMKGLPKEKQDEVKQQHTMFLRDILPYLLLRRAIKSGDVGMLEKLLPFFFLRFIGGGNGNYATECIELLQGLHREWPAEIAQHVRMNCWLMTISGRPNSFVPFDQKQEHNNRDIKADTSTDTYRSEGPNIDWKFLKKLHPAVPTIRAVTEHIEDQFETYTRGKRHTAPKKVKDIQRLVNSYKELHKLHEGRTLHKDDRAKDYLLTGADKVLYGGWLDKWHDNRFFVRSTQQMY